MPIALLTDFGTSDHYVGVMKGVIAGICPDVQVIDITHAIEPQNVRQGAFTLFNAYRYFPAGTLFVAVVDPGVGSVRQAIGVQAGGYTFIAPDNGLLSDVLHEIPPTAICRLDNPVYHLAAASNTFHGRDIFAPAAAHLAAGVSFADLGTALDAVVMRPGPVLRVEGDTINGEVLHIDHFGNIITSIGRLNWQGEGKLLLRQTTSVQADVATVSLNGQQIQAIAPTYSRTQPGDLLALIGSSGYLEIAVNQGNAAVRLGTKLGDAVELRIS